jgi:hypothetical protein
MNKVKVEKIFNSATGVKVTKEINSEHLAEYLAANWHLAKEPVADLPELKGIKNTNK